MYFIRKFLTNYLFNFEFSPTIKFSFRAYKISTWTFYSHTYTRAYTHTGFIINETFESPFSSFKRSPNGSIYTIHRFDLPSRFHLGITESIGRSPLSFFLSFFFPQPTFSISRKWRLTGSTCRPLADTNRFPPVPPCRGKRRSPSPQERNPFDSKGVSSKIDERQLTVVSCCGVSKTTATGLVSRYLGS